MCADGARSVTSLAGATSSTKDDFGSSYKRLLQTNSSSRLSGDSLISPFRNNSRLSGFRTSFLSAYWMWHRSCDYPSIRIWMCIENLLTLWLEDVPPRSGTLISHGSGCTFRHDHSCSEGATIGRIGTRHLAFAGLHGLVEGLLRNQVCDSGLNPGIFRSRRSYCSSLSWTVRSGPFIQRQTISIQSTLVRSESSTAVVHATSSRAQLSVPQQNHELCRAMR